MKRITQEEQEFETMKVQVAQIEQSAMKKEQFYKLDEHGYYSDLIQF